MENPWNKSRWLRWSSIATVAGAVVLIADFKGALGVVEPWVPALRGWVVTQIKVFDDSSTQALNSVRRKLLTEQIKTGEKYRLDLAVQKLDLQDRLVGLPLGPNRTEVNKLLAETEAAINASNADDTAARCELALLSGGTCQPSFHSR